MPFPGEDDFTLPPIDFTFNPSGAGTSPFEDRLQANIETSLTEHYTPLVEESYGTFFEELLSTFPVLSDLVETFTGVENGNSGDLGSWATNVLGRDVSLASRVARLENKIAEGAEFFDNFNRGDNDTVLGNGWTQGGDGQGLGIHDQAAQIKRDALPDDGTRYAICPQVASGDDFTVAAVIHPAGVSINPETVLYARCDTAMTAGVCVRMESDSTYVARFTRSGSTFSYTNITSNGARMYSNSATIEFKGEGTTLQVLIDGVLVHDVVDAVHTIGASNRTVGFSAQCWTAILQFPQYSGGLASFAMRSAVELTAVQAAATAATTAQTAAEIAQTSAEGAQQVGIDNSAAISDLQSQLSGEVGASGYSYQYAFDGSALDSDWTTYDPNGTGTQVGGGQVEPDDNAVGNIFHLFETALPGDDFDISFTLGDDNSHGTECTGLVFRSNTDMTDFARIYTFSNQLYLGRSTRPSSSSNSVTTYDWGSVISATLSPGKQVRVQGVGNTYRVWVGGSLVRTHTNTAGDSGGLKNVGASYRHGGLQQEYDSALFHGRSAGVAHFTIADYTAPTYTGTGWRLTRSTTSDSSTATWGTSGSAMNASTFDTTERVHGNCTVDSQGLGRVRVTQAGTYDIEVQVEFAGGGEAAEKWVGVFTGATSSPATLAGRSVPTINDIGLTGSVTTGGLHTHTGISSSGSHSHTDSFAISDGNGCKRVKFTGKIWLNANDYIQVCGGNESSSGSVATRGDAAGVKTFFAGFRLG